MSMTQTFLLMCVQIIRVDSLLCLCLFILICFISVGSVECDSESAVCFVYCLCVGCVFIFTRYNAPGSV